MMFKKAIFTLIVGFAAITTGIAQSTSTLSDDYVRDGSQLHIRSSDNFISFGFGVGGSYPYAGVSYSASPNLALSYEHTVIKHAGPGNIGAGLMLSYQQIASNYTDYSATYHYMQNWNYYIIGARVAYHLTELQFKGIEPYAGGMVGYYITHFSFSSNDPNSNEPADPGYYLTPNVYPNFFALSVFAGVRSYISAHSSAWLEFGYGYTTLAAGITYKI